MKKFLNAFNKAVTHNQTNDKKKSFSITYKKLNGRTVKRRIDPVSMRNNVVVAFDHKRKALRSFKIERLKGMEKAALDRSHAAAAMLAGIGAGLAGYTKGRRHGRDRALDESAYNQRQIKELEDGGYKVDSYITDRKKGATLFSTDKGILELGSYGANMKKTAAFWKGFEKSAFDAKRLAIGAGVLGAGGLGYGIGHKKGLTKGHIRGVNSGILMMERVRPRLKDGEKVQYVFTNKNNNNKILVTNKGNQFGFRFDKQAGMSRQERKAYWDNQRMKHKDKIDLAKSKADSLVGHGENALSSLRSKIKQASATAAIELAGLGTLAAPSVQALRGKPMKEHTKEKVELAGLGILAAPYVKELAEKGWKKAKPLLKAVR
jgi:hypothetical protein